MADTDSTKALYFTHQLRFALEAFEAFLDKQGFSLGELFLPIVHVEADYKAPLKLWDEVQIEICCSRIGQSSFTIDSRLGPYGTVQIVHVCTNSRGEKQPISPALRALLEQLALNKAACHAMAAAKSSAADA